MSFAAEDSFIARGSSITNTASVPKLQRTAVAAAILIISMQPFAGGALGRPTRLAAYLVAGLSIAVTASRSHRSLRMLKQLHLGWLMSLPIASVIWSSDRGATLGALASLLGATAIGLLICQELGRRRAVDSVVFAGIAALALSVVAQVFVPLLRASDPIGVSGIFEHKNALGRTAIILACASLFKWSIEERRGRSKWGIIMLFSVAIGLWSGSGTATFVVTVGLAILAMATLRDAGALGDRRLGLAISIVASTSLISLVVLLGPVDLYGSVLAALGREVDNNSLFVRLSLWEATVAEIVKRPLFGFGYGTFDFQNVRISTGRRSVIWEAQQPHNGGLDVWYQLGLAGILLYVRHFTMVWRAARTGARAYAYRRYLVLLMLANVTYSVLYGTLAIFWIVHIILVFSLTGDNSTSGQVTAFRAGRSSK